MTPKTEEPQTKSGSNDDPKPDPKGKLKADAKEDLKPGAKPTSKDDLKVDTDGGSESQAPVFSERSDSIVCAS